MKRKKAGARIKSLRQVGPAAAALKAELRTLVSQIVRWIEDERPRLALMAPQAPDGLSDRALDNWMPLLSIADALGGSWPERARQAAKALSGPAAMDNESQKVALLSDIRDLYNRDTVDRFSSEDLCNRLASLEERPWADWKQGKPITPSQLARQLKPFGVASRTIRITDQATSKGYLLESFTDSFERYLPSFSLDSTLSKRNTDTTCSQSGDNPFFQDATEGSRYLSENGLNPAPRADCVTVTSPNGDSRWEETREVFVDAD